MMYGEHSQLKIMHENVSNHLNFPDMSIFQGSV
jgi:hypothetical protein